MAGMGQRQGQGRRQPGIVRDKGERQHHADRVDRQRQILQRPGEGGQRTGDLSAKDHPHHFPSLEIVQSAARSSASR